MTASAVIFDFSDTLFTARSDADWVRRTADQRGEPMSDVAVEAAVAEMAQAWRLPDVVAAQPHRDTSAEQHRRSALIWLRAAPLVAPMAEDMYARLQEPAAWRIYDDAASTVRTLHKRGIPIAIISDIGWDIAPILTDAGLADCISGYVLSYQHGVEKPDPSLFRAGCELLGSRPGDTLMVGDNPTKDGGAVGIGMSAYLLPITGSRWNPQGSETETHTVRGLAPVLALAS